MRTNQKIILTTITALIILTLVFAITRTEQETQKKEDFTMIKEQTQKIVEEITNEKNNKFEELKNQEEKTSPKNNEKTNKPRSGGGGGGSNNHPSQTSTPQNPQTTQNKTTQNNQLCGTTIEECEKFQTREHAQLYFTLCGQPTSLDPNNNSIACEANE